jgi:hypothetical protein
MDNATDKVFAGSIPKLYETHLVPLIFQPYADDLAKRLSSRTLSDVLEIAAGTGVATRAMASALGSNISIIATVSIRPCSIMLLPLEHRVLSSGGRPMR